MGYATKPHLIHENVPLLERILERIDRGEELRFRVEDNAEISSEQYKLRRILAACDNHPLELGGKFARLGKRVTLRIDGTNGLIIASPRTSSSPSLEEFRANESDALDFLSSAKGELTILEFFPSSSFRAEEFERRAEKLGWKVFVDLIEKDEKGKVSLPAERIPDEPESLSRFLRE